MRKEVDISITDKNRDEGKSFHLTEMPALRAEKWAMRALAAAVRAGVDIGEVAPTMGMQGVAIVGIQAILRGADESIMPLLDEMLTCITVNTSDPRVRRPLMPDDIEEVSTLIHLRMEVLKLHVGFSLAGPSPMSAPATSLQA